MKTWHILAATAWVAAFLGLARTAAGLKTSHYASFDDGIAFAITTLMLFVVTMPVAVGTWFCVLSRDAADDYAGCLGTFTAMAIIAVAIGLFCWFGA
jgi:hypothetical protein